MRVGVIGLGIMGEAIAANLVAAGFVVCGHDRAPDRMAVAASRGVAALATAGTVAEHADVVVISLPTAQALDDVAVALAASGRHGMIVVETSTLAIADKERARDVLAAAGLVLLDCPLSGTGAQAARKDVVVYGSGDAAAYRQVVPVLDAFARGHHYLGTFGNGSRVKLVANLLVAIHSAAAAEALVLAMKAGLDPELVHTAVADGAGTSRMFELRGPMMARGVYRPAAMKLDVWRKDLEVIGGFAAALDCPTPLFASAARLYAAAAEEGRGDEDTAAVCAVLERLADIRRP